MQVLGRDVQGCCRPQHQESRDGNNGDGSNPGRYSNPPVEPAPTDIPCNQNQCDDCDQRKAKRDVAYLRLTTGKPGPDDCAQIGEQPEIAEQSNWPRSHGLWPRR